MLLLKRKATESIVIGDNIKVTVIKIVGGEVQLGIDAPTNIRIDREEVRADRNRRRKTGLVTGLLIFLAGLLQGADYVTVTGHVASSQSSAFTNEYLTFTPDNNGPILNPPLLISTLPVFATSTPPVGYFEINLEQGKYNVQIGRDRRNRFEITIPAETTETNHINEYVTAGASTNFQAGDVSGWTKSAANARFVSKSNSWSISQVLSNAIFNGPGTNIFFSTNGAAPGYILKTFDGSNWVAAASGGGESTSGSNLSDTNATTFGVFYRLNGTDLEHRTVSAGANMVITNEGTNLVFASTASGGVTGGVIVYHDDGTATQYTPSADTDAARGQALTNALDGASSGESVVVGPGVYDFASGFYYINTNKTLSVKGAGKNATMITADVGSQGVIWNKNNGFLTLDSLSLSNKNAAGIGFKNDEDMTLNSVRTAGLADGATMGVNTSSRGDDTGNKLLAYDSEFWTGWDGLVVASTNSTVDLYNCLFKGYAVSVSDNNGFGVTGPGAVLRMYGGAVDMSYTNGVVNSIGVSVSGTATVELYGVKVFTDQGGAVASSDLAQNGSSVLKVSGTSYDPSNVTGTITPVSTPYSVSGDSAGIVVTKTTNSSGVIDFDLDIARYARVTNLYNEGALTNNGYIYPGAHISYFLGGPTRQWFNVWSENFGGTNILLYGSYQHQLATGNRVAYFDSNKRITNSAGVDPTELEYLDGITEPLTTTHANLQAATNALDTLAHAAQGGSVTLTNLAGTGAVTNVVSLSTTNGTSKPLTNSYTDGILTLYGLEAGANVTLTPNTSNIVIAASGGSATTNYNTVSFNSITISNIVEMDWRFSASNAFTWAEGSRQTVNAVVNTNFTGPDMSATATLNYEPIIVRFIQDGTGGRTFTHNGTTYPTRSGVSNTTYFAISPGPHGETNVSSDIILTVDGSPVVDPIDLDSGGEISVANASGTITFTIKDDIIAAANFADGDWGDVSVSGNSVTLDNDVVSTAEMADADHGFFTYSGGVASLDSGGLTSANLSGALTDETGSGGFVLSNAPAILNASLTAANLSGVAEADQINMTNSIGHFVSTLAGLGGANTNFTVDAQGPQRVYIDAGTTNVNLFVMNYSASVQHNGVLILTNLSGTSRTLSFDATTNKWISLQQYDGLSGAITVTNGTGVWLSYEILGTNTYYGFKHIPNPTN